MKGVKSMIVTAKAIYKNGRLFFYNSEYMPENGAEVIVNFETQPQEVVFSLRNSWSKYFPKDIDLDEQLRQIRNEWKKEMEEINV